MTDKLFGTDGMRGEAGRFPLDAGTLRVVGRSLARRLAGANGRAARVVTGRDTRESGAWIERALTEGAVAGGARCESAGVITTPGVAYLARTLPADAGVVVSASHNPYHDNGIKIFAPSGRKLDDATERLIEADIYEDARARGEAGGEPAGAAAGKEAGADESGADELAARYLDSTSTTSAARSSSGGWARRSSPTAQTSASPSTETPTAPSSWTRGGARLTATPRSGCSPTTSTGAANSKAARSSPP
ncbi:MAG: hypothetical protein LC800_14890 [Acidobacteria bacterium]|nr:hypothetical protein [Acidobacteriota bacterium]